MLKIADGQCGLCEHFGGDDAGQKLVQIRVEREAPTDMVATCGHPAHEPLQLRVGPTSQCSGFTPARAS